MKILSVIGFTAVLCDILLSFPNNKDTDLNYAFRDLQGSHSHSTTPLDKKIRLALLELKVNKLNSDIAPHR